MASLRKGNRSPDNPGASDDIPHSDGRYLYFTKAHIEIVGIKRLEKMWPGWEIKETQMLPEATDFRKQDKVRANYRLRSRKLAKGDQEREQSL